MQIFLKYLKKDILEDFFGYIYFFYSSTPHEAIQSPLLLN